MADNTFFNIDAESAVISVFLKNGDELYRNINKLTDDDFYDEELRKIFKAIRSLSGKRMKADIATLAEELKHLYGSDALMMRIMELIRNGSFTAVFELKQNIDIIKSLSFRRNLYMLLDASKKELTDSTQDVAGILDRTRQSLRDLVITGHTWHSMEDVLAETYMALERRSKGEEKRIPSGINALDKMTTGFHKGELTVIGARPAVGKSALAAHIALMAAQKGYKVGIVSREMTDIQYGLRIIARGTGIDNANLRTGNLTAENWNSVVDTMGVYSGLPISFLFSTRYIEDLKMEVQNKVDCGELDILILDYMQLMQTKRKFEQDYLRIAMISKALKDMTVDLNVAIIALAQVGRAAQNTMPSMSELRGSGDIEQDADNIIFIHKPENDGDKWVHPDDKGIFELAKREGNQYLVLNVAKQRQGETGSVPVIFYPNKMRFESILHDTIDGGKK